jgi:hypothetical protein
MGLISFWIWKNIRVLVIAPDGRAGWNDYTPIANAHPRATLV